MYKGKQKRHESRRHGESSSHSSSARSYHDTGHRSRHESQPGPHDSQGYGSSQATSSHQYSQGMSQPYHPHDFQNHSNGAITFGNHNVSLPSVQHFSPEEFPHIHGTPRVEEYVQLQQSYDPESEWGNNEYDYRPIPGK